MLATCFGHRNFSNYDEYFRERAKYADKQVLVFTVNTFVFNAKLIDSVYS